MTTDSAEGAALDSHGRKDVVRRHLRNLRPEGPALRPGDKLKWRTFGASTSFVFVHPRPDGRGY